MRVLCAKSRTQMLPHGGFRTAAGATLPSWPRVQACLRPANVTRTSKKPGGRGGIPAGLARSSELELSVFVWRPSAVPVRREPRGGYRACRASHCSIHV